MLNLTLVELQIHWDAGDHQDQETGIPGQAEVPAICSQVG